MMHVIVLFAVIGVTGAKWANFENQKCLEKCMAGTKLGNKLKENAKTCEDNNSRKRRSIDLDDDMVDCATYPQITSYLDKLHCELKANGWITEEGQGDSHQVDWNDAAVKGDIKSLPANNLIKEFFMRADPATIEKWIRGCANERDATLEEKLLSSEYCANKYTDDHRDKLEEIMAKYGLIIAQNMCLRTLFGVACECNDFKDSPLPENNN